MINEHKVTLKVLSYNIMFFIKLLLKINAVTGSNLGNSPQKEDHGSMTTGGRHTKEQSCLVAGEGHKPEHREQKLGTEEDSWDHEPALLQ